MAGWTNESFMADLAKEYPPDFDWDAVLDPDDVKPIYKVDGTITSKDGRITYPYNTSTEYATKEEAQEQIDKIKADPDFYKGHDMNDVKLHIHLPSLKIIEACPNRELWMWFNKGCREDILKGEKVFPMYLP